MDNDLYIKQKKNKKLTYYGYILTCDYEKWKVFWI